MSVELTYPRNDEVYEKVRPLAQTRQLDITEVVVDALNDLLRTEDHDSAATAWTEPDEAVEREVAAYRTLHPMLWDKFAGEHVAIHNGQLIDHDTDGVALSRRIDQNFPDKFVLIRQIEEQAERILIFRSPRLSNNF